MLEGVPAIANEVIKFIDINTSSVLVLIILGFIGGTLSGFLGSGGAFILTPGMMSLGVPGILAVGSNLTHKFGKALVGARKHGELGNIDAKLGLSMIIGLLSGVQAAVYINEMIFKSLGKAGSDLYISIIFVSVLSVLALFILKDVRKTKLGNVKETARTKIAERFQKIRIPPIINFKVANTTVSLWVVLFIGLATGYLAGTIGVGGFIGVPAMIYMLGVPTTIAAGTELFLAVFSGAFGAFSYALNGFVDIRLVLLLYLGSIVGVQVGAIATKIVNGTQIRLVLAIVIGLSALSRAIAIPTYLSDLNYLTINSNLAYLLSVASSFLLFTGAISGVIIIFISMKQSQMMKYTTIGRTLP